MEARAFHAEINGEPAGLDDLRVIATVNYGHFTSMQVRAHKTQGLSLHLARLDTGTRRLFGRPLDVERTRGLIRRALREDGRPASVRVNVFARELAVARIAGDFEPDILVTVGAGRSSPESPLHLRTVVHQRTLPEVKHVGTFENLYHLREAQSAGFDDVLFVTTGGLVIEGSTWNIGFFDGARVWFPDAPMLVGVSMQLLQAAFETQGVAVGKRSIHLGEVASFGAVFATNSLMACRPIARIDSAQISTDAAFIRRAREAAAAIEWEII